MVAVVEVVVVVVVVHVVLVDLIGDHVYFGTYHRLDLDHRS